MLNYVLSKATFEPPKHAFTPYAFTWYLFRVIFPKSTPWHHVLLYFLHPLGKGYIHKFDGLYYGNEVITRFWFIMLKQVLSLGKPLKKF